MEAPASLFDQVPDVSLLDRLAGDGPGHRLNVDPSGKVRFECHHEFTCRHCGAPRLVDLGSDAPALAAAARDTSRGAARRVMPRIGSDRYRIVEHVAAAGTRGATADEIEAVLRKPHQTASARVSDLVGDGWLVPSGECRPTRSGADAIVWRLSAAAREWWGGRSSRDRR